MSTESSSLPLSGVVKSEETTVPDPFSKYYNPERFKQFYPKSFNDLMITLLLIVLTFVCMTYFLVAFYNVLCPKDYGRRRSKAKSRKKGAYFKQIKESVPKVLSGHTQVRAYYVVNKIINVCNTEDNGWMGKLIGKILQYFASY